MSEPMSGMGLGKSFSKVPGWHRVRGSRNHGDWGWNIRVVL